MRLIALLSGLFFFASVARAFNVPLELPPRVRWAQDVEAPKVAEALGAALTIRKWQVEARNDDSVTAALQVEKQTLRVQIRYSSREVSFHYVESVALDYARDPYGFAQISPKANKWLSQLGTEVRLQVDQLLANANAIQVVPTDSREALADSPAAMPQPSAPQSPRPQAPPPQSDALLVFYRPHTGVQDTDYPFLYVDDEKKGAIVDSSVVRLELTPGPHAIKLSNPTLWHSEQAWNIDAARGDRYFYKLRTGDFGEQNADTAQYLSQELRIDRVLPEEAVIEIRVLRNR